jgi:hypothetical protein
MAIRGAGGGTRHDMRRIGLLLIVLFIFSFLSLSAASAQVQVRIRGIHASDAGSGVDPSLRDLHKDLGSLFSFNSYRLMRDETLNLSLNQPASISSRDGTIILETTLVGLHKGFAEVRIKVVRDKNEILNTQVRLFPGRTVLVGGPRHTRGGVVIYALHANF